MDTIQSLFHGFAISLAPSSLIAAAVGAFLGIVIGALPGLGSITAIALLLPVTFSMPPEVAIIMLAGIYFGCMFGGAYSAILLGIPGDPAAVMTALDGRQLSLQGEGSKALIGAIYASFFGGLIGIIILTFMGPSLAIFGLKFGPAETSLLILLALCSIGWLLGEDPVKGILSTFFGIAIACIGISPSFGIPRYTFGTLSLINGVSILALIVGVFGLAQVLDMMRLRRETISKPQQLSLRDCLRGLPPFRKIAGLLLRSGTLGTLMGVVPGAGATSSSFLSYILEKKFGRDREQMGHGSVHGVMAAEAGNNSAAVGSFAPLLSLGIPGSGTGAVLLAGLTMWGLQPGPLLFQQHPDFVWGLISSMYIGQLMAVAIAILIIPFLVRILTLSYSTLIPLILAVCIVAAYSQNSNTFDIYMMCLFGVGAWLMSKAGFPMTPLLMAFVLTPRLEASVRQAFDISAGNPSIFVSSWIGVCLLFLVGAMLVSLIFSLLRPILTGRRAQTDQHTATFKEN